MARRSTTRMRSWLMYFLVVAGLLVLHYAGPLQFVEVGIVRLAVTIQERLDRLGRGESTTPPDLQAALKQLNDLQAAIAKLQGVAEENQALRAELNFLRKRSEPTVIAYVLNQESTAGASLLVLDQGSGAGVRAGDAITKNGVLLGKIIRAEVERSIGQLITDPAITVSASVSGRTEAIGIVRGSTSTALEMSYIPQTATIAQDDLVMSQGTEPGIPPGLLIGHIIKYEHRTGDLFQTAVVQPPPSATLDFITILRKQ